ncbi:hypothetical protein RUM43_004866 [Polyplax serrata]|uniref:Tetratricopeptide repeat protein 39C n=1 Tax=Polyplax serrata TaxID=468196 RepID=A0AAN8XNW1_POLSC
MNEPVDQTQLAREGIKLLLNNQFEEAEELFGAENGSVQMAAGYCFLTFMNALMTFEDDKLEESLQNLKDIEKRCTQNSGWLKSMKNKDQDVAAKLEEQIILADSQVCVALLTFLQQDLTSYVRGGWVLRKAWKVYQHTYSEILDLYKKTFGCDASVAGSQFPAWQVITKSTSNTSLLSNASSTSKECSAGSSPNSSSFKSPLSYLASFAFPYNNNEVSIEPQVVARLMSAVSFGYGIFQLCISLLPSSLLRLIHFLGFESDRNVGLAALMFSREGTDMRGPLASLALLWYHTIVRPFFALDGSSVQPGVDEADMLINESQAEFSDSALFLYFKGRVQRLKSNIPLALEAYESAIDKSNQRELQLLCLHEIGWCYLIQLDWGNAFHCFNQLRSRSKWSKSFYTYLAMVCIGAYGDINYSLRLAAEIPELLNESSGGVQIETFIRRRMKKFPLGDTKDRSNDDEKIVVEKLSCELLILELLYFWNALLSCNVLDLDRIIENCKSYEVDTIVGVRDLIEGAVKMCTSDFEKAVAAFRKCLEKRSEIKLNQENNAMENYDHVSAFAMFEMATILLQNSETKEEGKQLLVKVQAEYKGYDFENRLSIRIHSMLKKID